MGARAGPRRHSSRWRWRTSSLFDGDDAPLGGERRLQQELAVVNGQVASNAVGLYKALGGSWNIEENTLDVTAAAGTAEDAG